MEPTTNPQPNENTGDMNGMAAGAVPGAAGADPAAAMGATVAGTSPAETAGAGLPPVAPTEQATVTPGVATGMPEAAPAAGAAAGAPTMPASPVDTTATPSAPVVGAPGVAGAENMSGLPLTEPIMRPDLPPAPDPVKQELESPMKAAGPVTGSIGSAISVSQDGTQLDANGQPIVQTGAPGAAPTTGGAVPNVAFNDPAGQPDATGQPGAPENKKKSAKKEIKFDLKNMNRATLVTLIVVAVMVVICLAAVLIMQLMN